jgi:hypothetical protein
MGTLLTKVIQCVCDPKLLWATTSGSNILSFYGRLGYTRLFARRPWNKRRTQKLARPRSWLPIDSTSRKVGIRKPRSKREKDAEYQRPSLGVYLRYLKIRLTDCWCEVLGDAWRRAYRHTENWMSGLIAVKYKKESIMLRYSF